MVLGRTKQGAPALILIALLAAQPASAREVADRAGSFRLDVDERGPSCVLAPADGFDEAACAAVTPLRPADVAATQTSSAVTLVGAVVVRVAGDFTYAMDVLREARKTTPELRPVDADDVATGFVARMQASLANAGVTVRREGLASLAYQGGVQIVSFEMRADGLPAAADCTEVALVLADGYTYTIELRGPSAHAGDLRDIAQASLATLHAAAPQRSSAYLRGVTAVRVAAVVFLAAALAIFVAVARRKRRAPPVPRA